MPFVITTFNARVDETNCDLKQTFFVLLNDAARILIRSQKVKFLNILCCRSSLETLRQRANARIVSTSLLPYGGMTYFINSFDYPNFLHH